MNQDKVKDQDPTIDRLKIGALFKETRLAPMM